MKSRAYRFKRLIFLLRIGIGDPLISPDLHEDLEDRILRDAVGAKYLCNGTSFFFGHGNENMFRADIFIREPRRLAQGGVEELVQSRGHIGLSAGRTFDLRQPFQGLSHFSLDAAGIGAELFDDFGNDALRLLQKREKEMLHIKGLVSVLTGQRLRLLDGFLNLQSEFIESHRDLLHLAS